MIVFNVCRNSFWCLCIWMLDFLIIPIYSGEKAFDHLKERVLWHLVIGKDI